MLSTYIPSKNNRVLFNDCSVQGIEIKNGCILKNITKKIPAGKKTVSFKRFYRSTNNNDIKCDLVLTVPFESPLEENMHIEVYDFKRTSKKSRIFRVVQLLEKPDSAPASLELDLQELKTKFDDEREGDTVND